MPLEGKRNLSMPGWGWGEGKGVGEEVEAPRPGAPDNFPQSSSAQAFPSFCSRTYLISVGCLTCYQRRFKCSSFPNVFSLFILKHTSSQSPLLLNTHLRHLQHSGHNVPKCTSVSTQVSPFLEGPEAENRVLLAALGMSQPCGHLNLGLLASRVVTLYISVNAAQSVGLCYGRPRKPRHT